MHAYIHIAWITDFCIRSNHTLVKKHDISYRECYDCIYMDDGEYKGSAKVRDDLYSTSQDYAAGT